jgi:endo-1,4-beta-xylanase
MHRRSSFVLRIATGALAAFSFGCSDGIVPTPVGGGGAGGAVTTGGQPETGGTVGSGGKETGGVVATGGQDSTGGALSSGGVTIASGGRTNTGGVSVAGTGGAPSNGGVTVGSGGTTNSGGVTVGSGGRTSTGGASTTRSGGATGGSGVNPSGGATTGAGGSTMPPGTVKKFFGNIDTQGQIRSDFKTYWDQFSPENAGKWGSVQSSSGSFNWNSLDAMYKYCTDNNILFKQHNFSWGSQQPSWVTSSNAMTAVPAWISAFCTRYPKVAMIDVVNEPLHNQAGYISGIGGAGSSGYDWIVQMFKWARASCPGAILILNDYNTIEYSSENGRIQTMVNAVTKAGGPIDGVGCQGHDVAKVSASTILTYTNNIISGTGLPVYITEMDIGVADDASQASTMSSVVTELWKLDQVKGFTYWGYIVGTTWRANTGLMTSSGTKRAAMTWLMSFLGR